MKGVSAQWNIFSLFQTPSIPLGRGFEKEKISGSAIRKNENNILGLKLVVQQKGSIIQNHSRQYHTAKLCIVVFQQIFGHLKVSL